MAEKANPLRNNIVISVFIYIVAGFMLLGGILTPFAPLEPVGGSLGFIYNTRASLVTFGLIFLATGAMLAYGRWKRSTALTSNGLFATFACFTFAAVLETVARHNLSVGNIMAAIIVAVLYLGWRVNTVYTETDKGE